MNNEILTEVACPPDREKLVVQMMFGSEQLAELNHERDDLELEIYPREDGRPWVFRYSEFIEALEKAKDKLAIR